MTAQRETLCHAFLRALPVAGAAISTLGPPFGSETVCASDRHAARIDELQFDLGEGPCWQAMTTRRPVLTRDLHAVDPRWPALTEALGGSPVASLFAFPLSLGSLNIGAVDLYTREQTTLTPAQVADATTLAGVCAREVLRRALSDVPGAGAAGADDGFSRREVHQATGMVLAQLGVSAADALLVISGYAFARGRTVRAVAADIVGRRVHLTDEWSSPSESLGLDNGDTDA